MIYMQWQWCSRSGNASSVNAAGFDSLKTIIKPEVAHFGATFAAERSVDCRMPVQATGHDWAVP
jgi:hypothetical protein